MIDTDIISVGAMRFNTTMPLTRNKKGLLIQHPYFSISDDNAEYHFNGKDVMWAFLDAMFPNDPLPRGPVKDDLWAPTMESPSMYQLFTDLAYEAFTEGNEYLVLYHTDGVVSMVQSLGEVALHNDIERAGTALSQIVKGEPCYSFTKYRDRKGTHLRRMVTVYHDKIAYEIIDLGARWYFRVVSQVFNAQYWPDGESICLRKPLSVQKSATKNGDKSLLSSMIWQAFNDTKGFQNRDIVVRMFKPLPALSSVLTREYDMLRWERYGGSA